MAVLPGRDRGLPQSNRGRIVVAQGELITISRQVVDGNGAPLSLAGRTLQVVVQDARGNDIAVVSNADITVSGTGNSTYSFAVPAAASTKVGNFTYALNDIGASKALVGERRLDRRGSTSGRFLVLCDVNDVDGLGRPSYWLLVRKQLLSSECM